MYVSNVAWARALAIIFIWCDKSVLYTRNRDYVYITYVNLGRCRYFPAITQTY